MTLEEQMAAATIKMSVSRSFKVDLRSVLEHITGFQPVPARLGKP
jgi:hypothetical protein